MEYTSIITERDLDLVYLALLGRKADDLAIGAWADRRTLEEVLSVVFASEAFIAQVPKLLSAFNLKNGARRILETNEYYSILRTSPLSSEQIVELIASKCFGGDYYEFHKRRFCELHGLVAAINAKNSITSLLDISTMPFTTSVWKLYLNHLTHHVTIDLPASRGGPDASAVLVWGSDRHFSVDLNGTNLEQLSQAITEKKTFDLVVATEVIEHLQKDFSEVAEWILRCLAPDGVAIVTTPNALSLDHVLAVARGQNIQPRFTNFFGNKGGHYHFREYTMQELIEDIQKVGGEVFSAVYSSCLRPEELTEEQQYHLRRTLTVTFGHSRKSI